MTTAEIDREYKELVAAGLLSPPAIQANREGNAIAISSRTRSLDRAEVSTSKRTRRRVIQPKCQAMRQLTRQQKTRKKFIRRSKSRARV